jgi:hypothetical protein
MEPDGGDTNPVVEPTGRNRDDRSYAHSETKSIVLNVPITDAYGHCCRFEKLPRFIKYLRRVDKIDDTHFCLTTFLESQEAAPGRLGHRFRSAADTHLGEDRFTVRLHRPFCDKKGCRNLFIALSLCHQP